jgi:hypothetical protein
VVVALAAAVATVGVGATDASAHERTDGAVQAVIEGRTGAPARTLTGTANLGGRSVQPAVAADGASLTTLIQTSDDDLSLIAVLRPGQAAATFGGLLGVGERYEYGAGGGLVIVNERDEITAVVAAPWARDAKGRELPTHYTIRGSELVQAVDVAGAAFPVVADPNIQAGTYNGVVPVYRIQFTWTETTVAYRNFGTGRKVADIVCGFIPNAAVKALCLFAVNVYGQDVENNVRAAVSERRCLKLRVPAIPNAIYLHAYDAYRVTCTS